MKFSFIVPIYNIAQYLDTCIKSILMQDYKNFELILVNDGSLDNSKDICLKYEKDPRIKYFEKKNGGLSDARNFGIEEAIGDYLIFIDGDDFYNQKFLNKVNEILERKQQDILIINSQKIYPNGEKKISHPQKEMTEEEIIKKNIFKGCAWDKIVKREFIEKNKLKFEKGLLSEDILWCGQLLFYKPSISYYSTAVYSYRQRAGSITKTISKKHIFDYFYIIRKLLLQYQSKFLYVYLSFEFASLIFIISRCFKFEERKQFCGQVKENSFLLSFSTTRKSLVVKWMYKGLGYTLCCMVLKIISIFKK